MKPAIMIKYMDPACVVYFCAEDICQIIVNPDMIKIALRQSDPIENSTSLYLTPSVGSRYIVRTGRRFARELTYEELLERITKLKGGELMTILSGPPPGGATHDKR